MQFFNAFFLIIYLLTHSMNIWALDKWVTVCCIWSTEASWRHQVRRERMNEYITIIVVRVSLWVSVLNYRHRIHAKQFKQKGICEERQQPSRCKVAQRNSLEARIPIPMSQTILHNEVPKQLPPSPRWEAHLLFQDPSQSNELFYPPFSAHSTAGQHHLPHVW